MPERPRQYIAIVQDARGYPPSGGPREPAPPKGPAQPVLHTVVLLADYEALEAAVVELVAAATGVLKSRGAASTGLSSVNSKSLDRLRAAAIAADPASTTEASS